MLQALYRQTIAPQHLTKGDGGLALLVSLNEMREQSLAEKNICCNWIQKHHLIQAGVAMCSGKPLRDPATACISMLTRAARPRWQANNQWRPKRSTATSPSPNCEPSYGRVGRLPWVAAISAVGRVLPPASKATSPPPAAQQPIAVDVL